MSQLCRWSVFVVLAALFSSVSSYLPKRALAAGPPTVLKFDDVAAPSPITVPMPPGYGGVSWPNNMGIWGYDDPFNYVPQSPPNRAVFNRNSEFGVAESLVTFLGGPKIFDGAYFSGRYDVQFKLYSGATLVGTSSILSLGTQPGSPTAGPTFLASGYAGPVDKVGIVGDRGYFAMDNFTFEQVPEPSTLLLLGIGVISLLGYRRAKSHG